MILLEYIIHLNLNSMFLFFLNILNYTCNVHPIPLLNILLFISDYLFIHLFMEILSFNPGILINFQ